MLNFTKKILGFKKTRPQTFTIEDIRSWKPCYDPARHLPEGWKGTVLDILDHKEIPFQDKLWVICREELLSEKLMRLFAVHCARSVQHLMKDERSIKAIDVAERFALGKATEKEREAARRVAWAACGAAYEAALAACEAARAARWAAHWVVCQAASEAYWATYWAARAAYDAACGAAYWAAYDAAYEVAQLAQQKKLREMIIKGLKTGDVK